ncbi:MAG: SIS domain-containing protein [Verrucomicrobia bacterium]|nr:SIS domain-containing protein [Verrucomicrobiota bacterium]
MKKEILQAVNDGVKAIEFLKTPASLKFMQDAVKLLAECFKKKGKLLIAGNGGSMCDALHFAEELTAQFRGPRPALPAIALSEQGFLTAVGNDMGFENIFSRGVEALGQKGDVFIILTTSGNSKNLVKGVEMAKQKGLKTIAFLGKNGGVLKGQCDLEWVVPGFGYSDRIQEAHMTAIHIIIERLEEELFSPKKKISAMIAKKIRAKSSV